MDGAGDVEAQASGYAVEPDEEVELAWSELSVISTKHKKRLLDNVSGQVRSGFTAIMGPSGAGKSTLLNALACRMDKGAVLEGKARINGHAYSLSVLKRIASYVMQDDILSAHYTVEETLIYAAKLRLPCDTSAEERADRIEEAIEACKLVNCRHTLVGSPLRKGISGGERKRLCVAMELLTRPRLIFLDEPTSGLDSTTALSLCTLLRDLADTRRCTILCTIHQPSAKIFALFSGLFLLQGGKVVFQGPPSSAVTFFAKAGFPCPPLTNPADHVMDVISPANVRADARDASFSLVLQLQEPPIIEFPEGNEVELKLRERMPWSRQYAILVSRCWKEQQRRWRTVVIQLMQSVGMAALIGGVFFQIGTTQSSLAKRLPVLFFCTINQGMFGSLAVVNSFPAERVLTLRERAAGMYYVSAYFLAKTTAEALVYIISPLLFSVVAYWMIGLQLVFTKFLIFTAFMVLCQQAAVSLAQAVSAVCRDVDTSVVVLPMFLEISRLFGGFFLAPALQKKWMIILDYLSYVRYSYMGIALNELDGLVLSCTPTQLATAGGTCPITSGQQTITSLDLDKLSIGENAGVLFSYVIICKLVAFLALRYIKR